MKRSNVSRIIAIIVAACMLLGVMVGIFVALPLLLLFLVGAGAAGFLVYRFMRKKRVKKP